MRKVDLEVSKFTKKKEKKKKVSITLSTFSSPAFFIAFCASYTKKKGGGGQQQPAEPSPLHPRENTFQPLRGVRPHQLGFKPTSPCRRVWVAGGLIQDMGEWGILLV